MGGIPTTRYFRKCALWPPATFNGAVESIKSGENGRPQSSRFHQGWERSDGSLNFELSYGTYDAF